MSIFDYAKNGKKEARKILKKLKNKEKKEIRK